ncbi:MAG: hypothetical protein K9I94_14550 [Bacteroidales bacterium]|nr:hypothetical protein [Bacteroidales bacterium]
MRKLGIILFLIAAFAVNETNAQRAKRTSAFNELKRGNLKKAMELIEPTIEHEKTKDEAKTWFYRGNIYLSIATSQNEEYQNLDTNSLQKAYNSYIKAKELDEEDEYKVDITRNMMVLSEQFYNQGVNRYNKGKYEEAVDAFQNSVDVSKKLETVDTMSYYNAALASVQARKYDVAKKYYHKLLEIGYDKKPGLFAQLANIYLEQYRNTIESKMQQVSERMTKKGVLDLLDRPDSLYRSQETGKDNRPDTTKWFYTDKNYKLRFRNDTLMEFDKVDPTNAKMDSALSVVKQGREKFPDNFNLIITETNIYLASGQTQKALKNLELALEKDTTNPTIYFAVGANYDQLIKEAEGPEKEQYFNMAQDAYKSAIKLDSTYFEPHYNLGALYVNKAAELQNKANALPLDQNEKYKKLKGKADSLLQEATPFLERALRIKPNDYNTMVSLKEIYTRLNLNEKLKGINEKIQQFKKQRQQQQQQGQ